MCELIGRCEWVAWRVVWSIARSLATAPTGGCWDEVGGERFVEDEEMFDAGAVGGGTVVPEVPAVAPVTGAVDGGAKGK
jgi:hypothetical protein